MRVFPGTTVTIISGAKEIPSAPVTHKTTRDTFFLFVANIRERDRCCCVPLYTRVSIVFDENVKKSKGDVEIC